MSQQNGKMIITLNDNTLLEIPNHGVKCYPKRAVLRMGMLLRDSRVAKEIRSQLSDTHLAHISLFRGVLGGRS